MVFLSNPPEVDKSQRYAQKITRHQTLADKSSKYHYMPARPGTSTGRLFFFRTPSIFA
jgi:hypothetical protein